MTFEIRDLRLKIYDGFTLVFLFLAPWQTRWIFAQGYLNGGIWEYGTISIYAVEILLWIIFLLGITNGTLVLFARKVPRWMWMFGGLGAYVFLSTLWAPAPHVAIIAAFHFASAMIALWVVGASSWEYKKMAAAFVSGAVLQAMLGIAQTVFQWAPASTIFGLAVHDPQLLGTSVVMHAGARFLRAYGGLPHPNILGGYLAVALLLVFALIVSETKKRHHVAWFAALAILGTGLFFTFSRSAWLGMAAGLATWFVVSRGATSGGGTSRWRLVVGVVALVMAFGVAGFFFRDALIGRVIGGTQLEANSITERVGGLREAMAVWRSSPFFGVGIGNYTVRLAELAPEQPSWFYQPVHNVPILMVAELGLMGIMLVFCVILNAVKNLRRMSAGLASARDPSLSFRKTGVVILSTLIIISLFDHYLWSLYPGLLLVAVSLGLCHSSFVMRTSHR